MIVSRWLNRSTLSAAAICGAFVLLLNWLADGFPYPHVTRTRFEHLAGRLDGSSYDEWHLKQFGRPAPPFTVVYDSAARTANVWSGLFAIGVTIGIAGLLVRRPNNPE